jgi:O-antigen/teichoic acid export membrane protein
MASLRANVVANYASQAYVALIGLSLVPIHLRLLGAEGYGLVGVFTLMQTWFQVFDVGLTPTISRETARYQAGAQSASELRGLLRAMEGVFFSVALIAAVLTTIAAPAVAEHWLKPAGLSPSSVALSIVLMAWTVALRWISGLYRGVVSGMERQVWLGAFNAVVVTLRFAAVIPVLLLVAPTPVVFFVFQSIVSVFELATLVAFSYAMVPLPEGAGLRWSWAPLKKVWEFSAIIAFASTVSVLVSNADRLILSKLLSLADFGFFTAAVLVASVVTLSTGPITLALLPRLTRYAQQSDFAGFVDLYRQATQAVAVIAGSGALLLAALGGRVLWLWSGNLGFASDYAHVVMLYAIGNGFFALASFPFFLQYARGNLRLHLLGSVVFLFALVPTVVVATLRFGVTGAGAVWALMNATFFLAWTAFIHKRLAPGLHATWLKDVLRILVGPALICTGLLFTGDIEMTRVESALFIFGSTVVVLATALWGATLLKPKLRPIMAGWFAAE